jgi:hypothetical protein
MMPNIPRIVVTACIFRGLIAAQSNVGFVLDKQGGWTLAGSRQELSAGQQLPAKGLLSNSSPSDGDRIVIADLNGAVIKRVRCRKKVCRECSESGACYDSIRALPLAGQMAGALASSFAAVMDLFAGKPERYSAHRVRGEEIAEGVLQLKDGRCDLAPAFQGLEKDRYYVQLKSLSVDAGPAPGVQPDPISFDWDASKPSPISVAWLQRGLYDLILLTKDGTDYYKTGVDAWALVSDAADYRESADEFERATALAAKWGNDVSPEMARGYLRANLEYLASRAVRRNAQDTKK